MNTIYEKFREDVEKGLKDRLSNEEEIAVEFIAYMDTLFISIRNKDYKYGCVFQHFISKVDEGTLNPVYIISKCIDDYKYRYKIFMHNKEGGRK